MIGIIGGTGLYSLDSLTDTEQVGIDTPFGPASSKVTVGRMGSAKVAFLPRHGAGHQLLPSEINFRANLWALKSVGVRRVVSVSAVGSLAKEIRPGDLAMPSQYLDFTKGRRPHTYFGEGIVAHISTAEPTCLTLAAEVKAVADRGGVTLHAGKTYACVEGPRLGNRAESRFMQQAGCHLVGMTNVPEVYLAREAQLCYCTIAVVTDYDCWLEDPSQHATVEKVLELYRSSIGSVKTILRDLLTKAEGAPSCSCRTALHGAVMTPDSALGPERRKVLELLRA
ncbi:MAG: S-methyl-5'-thioadenosine phosphorylase [Bdellovibrionales bacterium]|nr:S-methyl-5'-thioadenosine phosphorylase [Bdellovibrionales bacterium]